MNIQELVPQQISEEAVRTAYTEQDFLRGEPESIIEATEPRILVVWPHGDETLGARVGYHLYSQRPDLLKYVDYVCGNPAAASQDPAVRDTKDFDEPVSGFAVPGTDLNRQFSTPSEEQEAQPKSYERTRADMVKQLIADRDYDYILDLHTSKSNVDRCLIIRRDYLLNEEPAIRRIIAASRVSRIAVWPEVVIDSATGESKPLATDGLIGHYPNSVSMEYYRPTADSIGVQETIELIDGLLSGKPAFADSPRDLYHVTHTIPKGTDLANIVNFQRNDEVGGWPVLCSEASDYKNDGTKFYSGFLATDREIQRI